MLEKAKQKIIVFIGAGASKPFGIPDMKGFVGELEKRGIRNEYQDLQNLWDFVKNTTPPGGREEDLEWVLDFLNILIRSDLDFYTETIERLITSEVLSLKNFKIGGPDTRPALCEVLRTLRTEGNKSKIDRKSRRLTKIIKKYIQDICMEFQRHAVLEKWNPVFNSLSRVIGDDLWIFTTNYDLIIENYCQNENVKKGVKLCCGFIIEENVPRGIWKPGMLAMKKQGVFNLLRVSYSDYSKKLLRLFKLHGSCDWFKTDQGIFRLGVVGDIKLPGGIKPENILIYPGNRKEFYEQPFLELFSDFQEALFECNGCIAIGFSFRDEHITPLFRDRFARKSHFKLAIIDPEAEKRAAEHFSEHRNRIVSVPLKFGEDDWKQIRLKLVKFLNL